MSANIDRVDVRTKLTPRREPYWRRLAEGRHLGFRRMTAGTPGTWIARLYDGERYVQRPLGDLADKAEKDRYDAARREAEDWFRHLGMGGSPASVTVTAACEAYVDKLRMEKSDGAADDAKGRFQRLIYDDPLGKVEMAKLTPRHLAEWKKRVLAKMKRGSFNRNATPLRAAFNLAKARRDVATDVAWSEELKPFEGADGQRTLYLDRDQRRELIEQASDEVRPLLRGLALLPLRVGELASLKVEHFDAKHGVLRPDGKTGARSIPLGAEALAHFKECAKGKLPTAWLVARANGGQWDRFAWRDEVKLAAAAARLPRATCAYTLRHSVITDLVVRRLDLFTVAKISGTSVAMIEKHYGHLQREHARSALEALALD